MEEPQEILGVTELGSADAFIKKFSGLTESYWFYDRTIELRYDPKDHVYLLVTPDGQLEKQEGVTSICHIVDRSYVLIPWACKMMGQKLQLLTSPFVENEWLSQPKSSFDAAIELSKTAHKDKLEEAGNIGHIAHAWIESYINSCIANDKLLGEQILESMPAEERAKNACVAAVDWMIKHNIRWICTERKIYSKKYKYAGTMDGMCLADSCQDPNCCKKDFKNHLAIVDWKTSNYLYVEYLLQTAAYKQAYQEETKQMVKDRWVIRLGKEDAEFESWHLEQDDYPADWQAFRAALELSRSMGTVEARIKSVKDVLRNVKKKAKADAKLVSLKIKCRAADKYKGMRKPTCNNGDGCEFCLKVYQEAQANRLKKLQEILAAKEAKKADKLSKKKSEGKGLVLDTSPELMKAFGFLLNKPLTPG